MRIDLVYIADKVGISTGYQNIWASMLLAAKIDQSRVRTISIYRQMPEMVWLRQYANRKAPTWNPSMVEHYRRWLDTIILAWRPTLILSADPASLWLCNADASFATLDNLRGGVYDYNGTKVLLTLPITAWHQQMKEKDIAAANKGFTDKNEFEEFYSRSSSNDDDEESDEDSAEGTDGEAEVTEAASDASGTDDDHESQIFYTPLIVPYGKFVLNADMMKAGRIIRAAHKAGA